MAVEKIYLEQLLSKHFVDSDITITDLLGDQDHYSLVIKSAKFKGLTRINQHKMVKDILKNCLATNLHAITIKTEIKD